jgi:arylsulfatase A-like enzyme
MDELKRLGLDDNTIVFFTSDNGAQGSFGGVGADFFDYFEPMNPYRGSKGSFYDGGIRVPMIARWPGRIDPGTTNETLAWYFADVLPTFAELAGVEPPDGLDGMSVVPALIGEKAAGHKQQQHEYLYWEMNSGQGLRQSMRMGNWKAVREQGDGKLELFDISADPGESRDVSSANPDVMARVEKLLSTCRTTPRPQMGPVNVQGWRYF